MTLQSKDMAKTKLKVALKTNPFYRQPQKADGVLSGPCRMGRPATPEFQTLSTKILDDITSQ